MEEAVNRKPALVFTGSLAQLLAGVAVTVASIAWVAGLREAAVHSALMAENILLFMGLTAAMLWAFSNDLRQETHAKLVRQAAALVFAFGALSAASLSIDYTSAGRIGASIMLTVVAATLAGVAWRGRYGRQEAIVEWMLSRIVLFWSAACIALVAIGELVISVAGRDALHQWVAQTGRDGLVLGIAPLMLLANRSRWSEKAEQWQWLPARWLPVAGAYLTTAAGATALQAWLWRYPGARATGALILFGAALAGTTMALLVPRHGTITSKADARSILLAADAVAVVMAIAYMVVVTLSRNIGGVMFSDAPPSLWPWGYRISLALLGLASTANRWTRLRSQRLSFGILLPRAVVALALIGVISAHWAILIASANFAALCGAAGLMLIASAIACRLPLR